MTPDLLPARIQRKIRVTESGCWAWTGRLNNNGYGQVSAGVKSRNALLHRFVYELLVGPIPDGLHIDHQCAVRHCCNPNHLEAVTPAVNNARSMRRRNPPVVGCEPPPFIGPPRPPVITLPEDGDFATWFMRQWAAAPREAWEQCGVPGGYEAFAKWRDAP